MKEHLKALMAQIFPILSHIQHRDRIHVALPAGAVDYGEYEQNHPYAALTQDELEVRIREEHTRVKNIEEKTYRHLFVMTVLFPVAAFLDNSLFATVTLSTFTMAIKWTGVVYIVYFNLCPALFLILQSTQIALHYGYGTNYLTEKQKHGKGFIIHCLVKQEELNIGKGIVNIIVGRYLRNCILCLTFAYPLLLANPAVEWNPEFLASWYSTLAHLAF